MNFFTTEAITGADAAGMVDLTFDPSKFVTNLQYMGIGMLVIFAVIGVIMLTTLLINKIFAD